MIYDAVVIGAGVVGGLTARELTRYGMKTCILEKENDVAMGATRANSGIVHAGFDAECGSLKARLNVRGAELMEKTAAELGVKYRKNGSIVIGFNDEDKAVLYELLERGRKNGVRDLRILDAEEVHRIEKNLSDKVSCALYAPSGAIVCPYGLCIAAVGNAMDNGAELFTNFEVSDISRTESGYKIISADGKTAESRLVVNSAGIYSDKIAALAGDTSFTVHPRKGEYILLDRECGGFAEHTVFRTPGRMGKGILVSPTADGNLLTGPTAVDTEDKDNTETTAEGFDKIIKEAKENFPSVPFNKTITSFCGLRAAGSTGDFIIRESAENFITLAGIESPGLSASPAIAEYVVEMLKSKGFELTEDENFNPFRKSPHRFAEASLEEKNEIIKKDKSFGKIVCRCEGITEGEILEAIRSNPKARDLDGVKRRTRAQMGRCQGGFCSPYITELISKELGIDFCEVTKSGKGSYINVSKTKEGGEND